MPDPRPQLSSAAIRLIGNLVGTEPPLLSAAAFDLLPETSELLRAGLLCEAGHEMVVVAQTPEGEEPVEVLVTDDAEGWGRFSPSDGWLDVAPRRLTRWALDVDRFASLLAQGRQPAVIDRLLWNLGNMRLPARPKPVEVWLARATRGQWDRIRLGLLEHPASQRRVLLLAGSDGGGDQLPRTTLVPLVEVISSDLKIDPARVSARLESRVPSTARLVIRDDGAEVELDGVTHRFEKGVQQKRVIAYLEQALRRGRRAVSVPEVVEELGLSSNRLRELFKGHPTWTELLFERGGMCGFRLDE